MAFFGAEIRKIKSVATHPNADLLSIVTVEGLSFQVVTKKDQFQVGSDVIYIPVDSLLPEDLQIKVGLQGKLAGKLKNRVKTISLRQAISQGIVVDPKLVLPPEMTSKSSEEITSFLGIEKFEPPVKYSNAGTLLPLPEGSSKYDIEGADRFSQVVEELMDQEVVVHEKMEGTNFSIVKKDGKIFVNQRSNTIEETPGQDNVYWKAARDTGLLEKVKDLEGNFAIYAELCGPAVQGNIYQLRDLCLFIFDVKVDNNWLSYDAYQAFIKSLKVVPEMAFWSSMEVLENFKKGSQLKIAPLLFKGILKDYLQGKTVQEASNGKSIILNSQMREGIVIKPVQEKRHDLIGRLIIKQRSPEYLAKES